MPVRPPLAARAAACLAVLLLSSALASAAPAGFAFLEVPAGARAAGLGGAYASLADGIDAAFWNPAGLEGVRGTQVAASHAETFQQLRHDQFAIGGHLFGGGVAASLRALYSEPIDERDELGNLIGSFGAHDLEFALGYGRSLGGGLRLGGSAQFVRERIANLSTSTWATSMGATLDPARWPNVRLSASVHDLGPAAHYEIDGVRGRPVGLPASLQSGASVRFGFGAALDARAALETRLSRGRPGVVALGGELETPVGAAVRLGVRSGDTVSNVSFGAGYARGKLHVDYAFVPSRLDLEDTHRFSFTGEF